MPADKPTGLSRIKLKPLTHKPVHAYTHTSCMHACIHTCMHACMYTYMFVVNFDALVQAIDFRIEKRQVFLWWMQDSKLGSLRHQFTSRLNAAYMRTCIHTYIFVVVDFDALAQASGFRIERIQVVFLCWMQDSNTEGTYIHTCLLLLISMLWHRQAIFESKGDKLSSSAEGRIRTQGLRYLFTSRLNARWQTDWAIRTQGLRYLFTSRLNACWQTDWAIEDQAKNLNSTARPYDQQAFSPLDLQTEATPPAASCPARTLHATEIAPKNATQMRARGCTGQLTTCLECTWCQFQHLCVLILNSASCQLYSTFASCYRNCVKNTIPMTCPRLHWTTDNPSGTHTHTQSHTHTHTYIHAYIHACMHANIVQCLLCGLYPGRSDTRLASGRLVTSVFGLITVPAK